jgi:transcriptional regulator CtsR
LRVFLVLTMSIRKLAQLRSRLKRAGVKYQDIAAVALVTPSHVSHVLAGRFTSQKVLDVAARLSDEALAKAEAEIEEAASGPSFQRALRQMAAHEN